MTDDEQEESFWDQYWAQWASGKLNWSRWWAAMALSFGTNVVLNAAIGDYLPWYLGVPLMFCVAITYMIIIDPWKPKQPKGKHNFRHGSVWTEDDLP